MKLNIFENLTLKLVALLLAVITWFLVVGEQRSEVRITVPLELRNLPTNMEIVESLSQVEVTLRGFSSFVKRLTPGDIDVHIDLSNVVVGTNSFLLDADQITVPVGAAVIQVSPSQVEVTLDMTVSKSVPVVAMTRGTPADGYVIGEIAVEPATIKLTGAQSLLKTLNKVETETVGLDDTVETLAKKVKVKIPANSLRIENEEEKVVTVNVNIIPEMTERFFENIPLVVQDEDRPLTLSPDSITALISGPKLQLAELTSHQIRAVVNTAALPVGQAIIKTVDFKLPEAMRVKIYYPKTITINISGAP